MAITRISEKIARKVLTPEISFRLAKEVFLAVARRRVVMPPKMYLSLPGPIPGDFRAMPAFIQSKRDSVCGMKWISVFPENRRFDHATVLGTILLNSTKTGELLAVLEANTITALRTAATAALATHYLARPGAKRLAIVGSGLQAGYQLEALAARYSFDEIRVWGYDANEAISFCRKFSRRSKNLKACANIRSCVEGADILVTCTPSRKPLVMERWVKKGAHINAIGADAKGKEELDPKLLLNSKVIVDEWQQASHSGEINVPHAKGLFPKSRLHAELADIVSGRKRGRELSDEITVFDSTGLAVLDIHFAKYVYDRFITAAT